MQDFFSAAQITAISFYANRITVHKVTAHCP